MSDLVLTDNEYGLFELMRDEVVTDLCRVSTSPERIWRCTIRLECESAIRGFDSNLSALDAFMKARVYIITLKLEGKDIYSWRAKQKRRQLGLE